MNVISNKIGKWYDENKRELPWRETRDPYRIWLSETILQQTRVAQGLDYYLRFEKRFPNVQALASASEDEVLKLWQGLGYYSRARNLHTAAQQVVNLANESGMKGDDIFPKHYNQLIELKGVGPYTAAAIASFASDETVAVVDGNVYRVLSRLFDMDEPIDTGKGQRRFQELANTLLPQAEEGASSRHNQAMMEFGALHCTPASPRCQECPVAEHCLALANGTIELRPVKSNKVKIKERHLTYIIYIYNKELWVHQRGAGDIWQGLWEPFLLESESCSAAPMTNELVPHMLMRKKHQLTHQTLHADFWICQLTNEEQTRRLEDAIRPKGYRRVTWMDWQGLAVPRLIDDANRLLSTKWF